MASDFLRDRPDWIKNSYRLKLEVDYRRTSGAAFQLFFDRIMRALHGDDYSATATYGTEGDLGCDGLLPEEQHYFAVYAPSPYFRLAEARRKMLGDFRRLLECWDVSTHVKAWTFVVNYPGVHPSLLALSRELQESHPGLKVTVWSRNELTQKFLTDARMSLLLADFGSVEQDVQRLAPVNFVPEDTELPSGEATLAYRMLRAQILCQSDEYDELTEQWVTGLSENIPAWVTVHTHFLFSAMAAAVMVTDFDPLKPPLSRLKFETPISPYAWRRYFKTAWDIPASYFLDDSSNDYPHLGRGEYHKVCIVQDALTLGVIRVTARITDVWETQVLEEVWSHVTGIKLRTNKK